MEYPIWQLTTLAGGFWIALIATVHVFVAQFAVGGGLFLVLTEHYAYRKRSDAILDYVKKHTLFFLLLTMVFGALTGVGIWFSIALISPRSTIELIHLFVFGWATEWVFFIVEIVALIIYYYKFNTMSRRDHLAVGWVYFAAAWLSLFVIGGIIAFMLTPGAWLENGSFWSAFFNPTFWPSLVFRTFLSFALAGLYGFLTASRIEDAETRERMVRYCAVWALVPVVLMLASGWWYLHALPDAQYTMVVEKSRRMASFLRHFLWFAPAVVVGSLAMAIRMPRQVKFGMAIVVFVLGFAMAGSFEFLREAARKPYVIYDYIYSNGIAKAEVPALIENGALASAKWSPVKEVTEDNALEAGRVLFQMQCAACHSINGPMNDILPLTAKFPLIGMESMLTGLGRINGYMPPFAGNEAERTALARYIVEDLHGGRNQGNKAFAGEDLPLDIPPFDPDADEYVLLAWNNLGMHCISDSDRYFVILPPANDLYAQLIKRGPVPEVVTEGVEISYEVQPEFSNAAEQCDFWTYCESNFGAAPEPNVGLSGNPLSGNMHFSEELGCYESSLIPVVPYPNTGGYNPYPLFTIIARDATSGEELVRTKAVLPTSTEMGCRNCHGGPWKVAGLAGISDETASDVLAVHDRMSGTDLLEMAEAGNPRLCQSCHADPVLNAEGKPELLNLPAALHGLHANYLTDRGAEACTYCHPNRPDGPTRCLRGRHGTMGLTCVECHGTLEDHALSLLKKEQEAGKPGAERLMVHLTPRAVDSLADINARIPWLQEPDCAGCHTEDYVAPMELNAFNKWTEDASGLFRMRKGDMGAVMCAGCHNSPHANYPADNPYGADRDNIPPLQFQGDPGTMGTGGDCAVCHTMDMPFSAHHPNMLPAGN